MLYCSALKAIHINLLYARVAAVPQWRVTLCCYNEFYLDHKLVKECMHAVHVCMCHYTSHQNAFFLYCYNLFHTCLLTLMLWQVKR